MSSLENIKSSTYSKQLSQMIETQLQYLESTDFQLWIQNKTPQSLQPLLKWTLNQALNSALDWIRPELHRHGFHVTKLNQSTLEAELNKSARMTQKEIPLSVVMSSLEESLKMFFNQHVPGQQYEVLMSSVQIEKKQKWDDSVKIKFEFDEKKLDHDLLLLQKHKIFEFENQLNIKTTSKKSNDVIMFQVVLKLTPLLAFDKKGPQ